jgi:hypothetical protein
VLCESVESGGEITKKRKLGFGEILTRRAKQAHDAIVAARVTGRAPTATPYRYPRASHHLARRLETIVLRLESIQHSRLGARPDALGSVVVNALARGVAGVRSVRETGHGQSGFVSQLRAKCRLIGAMGNALSLLVQRRLAFGEQ